MMQYVKNTALGTALAKALAERGYRIFDIKVAREMGASIGIKSVYVKECLFHLKRLGWITPLKRGLYALAPILLGGHHLNEFEIATAIVSPASICYLSAFHFHKLTQQTPYKVFVMTTTGSKVPQACVGKDREKVINGVHYHFLSVKKDYFFGLQKVWYGEVEIYVTDLEKTLLDGITKPKYCGGFAEVLDAFTKAQSKLDLDKLARYASLLGASAERRLGWVLDYIEMQNPLPKRDLRGYIKLNASGDNKGKFNKKWGVRENI
jgi:predicted transcriptional regulator of viral defense system